MKLIIIDEDELEPDSEWSEYADGYIAYSSIQIQAAKVADAVPVVHAKWIHTGVTNIYGGHQHKCSSCGYSLMVSPLCDENEKYCCNCGARMDGEV